MKTRFTAKGFLKGENEISQTFTSLIHIIM